MSQLQTYHHPEDHRILSLEGARLAVNMTPGELVRHGHFDGTCGMLVANGDDFVTVLWSKAPIVVDVGTYSTGSLMYAPYVPLQVTPSIFASTGSFFSMPAPQQLKQNFCVTGSIR